MCEKTNFFKLDTGEGEHMWTESAEGENQKNPSMRSSK